MAGTNDYNLILQPRDRRLLAELEMLRVIDREQAQVIAPFRSITRANTRLLALTRAKLIDRAFVPTMTGTRKAVYYLRSRTPPSPSVFAHQLGINDISVALKYRAPEGMRLLDWRNFDQRLAEQIRLIPDGLAVLETPERTAALFVEVDRGTEPAKTWQGKLAWYLELARSGEFTRLFGFDQFRVLITTSGWTRCRNLGRLIGQQTDKIFWLTTINAARRRGVWADIWLRPNGLSRQTLFPAQSAAAAAAGGWAGTTPGSPAQGSRASKR
jgi:hypothetical protein